MSTGFEIVQGMRLSSGLQRWQPFSRDRAWTSRSELCRAVVGIEIGNQPPCRCRKKPSKRLCAQYTLVTRLLSELSTGYLEVKVKVKVKVGAWLNRFRFSLGPRHITRGKCTRWVVTTSSEPEPNEKSTPRSSEGTYLYALRASSDLA